MDRLNSIRRLLIKFGIFFNLLISSFVSYASLSLVDTTIMINGVTVYGERINREIIPVQTLGGEQLKKLSVYSVADAIRYFSGAQIKDYGGIGGLKTVNIRSMGSHHVGVFYDGIQLGNAQNGVIDLGRFSLDNMEMISLYNGQKSAIFQPAKDYASASTIYMQTRKPKFIDSKRNNWNVGIKGGSFATINPSILWEHQLNDKITSSVSSEFLYTSGRYKFTYAKKNGYDTTEIRKNGDVRLFRIETALFGKLTRGEWQVKAYLYNSERGYPGASVREEPGKFKHQDRQWDNNLFIQGSFRHSYGSFYSLLINGKYAYDYLHYLSDPRKDVSTMYINNRYTQQESYLSLSNLLTPLNWWSVSLSLDYQWNTLDADLVDFVYPNRYAYYSALATSLDFKRFKLQASLLNTHIEDKTRVQGAHAGQKTEWTPSVVASWIPFQNPDFAIRAFYKRIFRMPTLNDLYYTFIGNKDLDPEYTNQYNMGITYTKYNSKHIWQKRELQIDAYFNQVEDKIIAMPTSNQFRWTMINLGYVEIRGIDIALQNDFQFQQVGMATRLNYTYQKAQDYSDDTSPWYGGQIPYIPWHSGSIIVNISYKTWVWNYSYIYTGKRYEAVANIVENKAQPWYTHDLSLSKIFKGKNHDVRVSAEINNLFNQQYEVVQCYPMPGINFKIKLNILL